MSKHTPGQWKAQYLNADGKVIVKPGWEIATLGYDVVANIPKGAPIRKEADACLIVAAPELLKACKLAQIGLLEGNHILSSKMRDALVALKEVIRKAKEE